MRIFAGSLGAETFHLSKAEFLSNGDYADDAGTAGSGFASRHALAGTLLK
jgi:hypothetical protein